MATGSGATPPSARGGRMIEVNGARTPTTIPTADRKGVYAHLRQHLIDHGVEPEDIPTLRSPGASMTTTTTKTRKSTKPCPACGGSGKLTGGESPSENLPCPECEGDGEVPAVPMSTNSAAALRAGYRNIVERRQTPEYMPVEMRSVDNGTGGQALLFTGYASV